MSLASIGYINAHSLFGPYARREYFLADANQVSTFTNSRRHIRLRGCYDSPGMRELLLNIDREVTSPGFTRLKDDGTTTVGITSRDGRRLVIKRYNTKNAWHFLRRSIRRSRAQNCFEFGLELARNDIATAPVVGFVETRAGPLRGRSWLITEYVEGSQCLSYVLDNANQRQAAEIAARLEREFVKLASLNITHGDMKASNFILRENRFPVLIDLDGMRHHRNDSTYAAAHQRDLERFMKNWRERPELSICFTKVKW
ncbi:MAG: hypothetical protein DHS20C01_29860 [marine bacterium B5-7]|nr:MAG: hypothetical protein DHS20C01_29860 [marine bacterium B5-7]